MQKLLSFSVGFKLGLELPLYGVKMLFESPYFISHTLQVLNPF